MSQLNTCDLNIDQDLRAWIDPLSPEEYAQLESNILTEGCRDPIVVWGGYILDGHNRYDICSRHGIAFATVEKAGLVTKEDALVWMAQNQLGRRNLSDFTRAALALQLKPLIEQRAQQRMLAGRPAASDPTQKSAEGSGETREAIAKAAGVSRDTVRKVEKILESGNAEVTAQVRAGEISINAAAKKLAPQRAPVAAPPPAVLLTTTHAAAPAPATGTAPAPMPSLFQQVLDQQATPAADDGGDEKTAAVKMIEVDEEVYLELIRNFEKTLEDYAEMSRVIDADDRLQAAMGEIARYKAAAASAKQSLDSKMGENNELIRTVKSLRGQLEREKKRADDAERRSGQMRSAA